MIRSLPMGTLLLAVMPIASADTATMNLASDIDLPDERGTLIPVDRMKRFPCHFDQIYQVK